MQKSILLIFRSSAGSGHFPVFSACIAPLRSCDLHDAERRCSSSLPHVVGGGVVRLILSVKRFQHIGSGVCPKTMKVETTTSSRRKKTSCAVEPTAQLRG